MTVPSVTGQHARLRALEEAVRRVVEPLPGSRPYTRVRSLRIPVAADGLPLLEAMRRLRPLLRERDWRDSCDQGCVTVDGRVVDTDYVLRSGQLLEHREHGVVEPPVDSCIRFVYEDDDLLVIDKPAPLPMHPSGRFDRNTLIRILEAAFPDQRLRIAHRLDANTTGLVILSRRREAASVLQPMFQRGQVRKTYLARVWGRPPGETFACAAPIASGSGPAAVRRCAEDGQPAETRFRVLAAGADQTLLEVWPLSGRTHQIRVHLWHLGLPIVGDPTYLRRGELGAEQTRSVESAPMCLHAWRLELDHPGDGRRLQLEAASPAWSFSVC